MINQNPVQVHNPPRPATPPPVDQSVLFEFMGSDGIWVSAANGEEFFENHGQGSGLATQSFRITNIGPSDLQINSYACPPADFGVSWVGIENMGAFVLVAGEVSAPFDQVLDLNASGEGLFERVVTVSHQASNEPDPFSITMLMRITAPV